MIFEKSVTYTSPEKSSDEEILRHHKFSIYDGEKEVSGAEVHYISKPLPCYQVTELFTESEYQNKGLRLASTVMDKVEQFLLERSKPGILVDSIFSDVPEVQSMYERRGWKRIDEYGRRVFNLPEKIDPKIFVGYEVRGENGLENEDAVENRREFFKAQ